MCNKRRGQEEQKQGHGGDKRSRCRRKHLYLVLDDWENGFSIHKIYPETLDSDEPRRLPEPALLRLESPVGCVPHCHMSFSALGTKIFVLMNQRCALVYDTETAVLAVGPHAPSQMVCGFGFTVPAGGMLYALSHRFFDKHHSFEVLEHSTQGWSWKTLPTPPPTFTSRQRVISYALHPDGCTIFMTTAYRDTPGAPLGTYSFNTKHSQWRRHGDWALPFDGQGYYDTELDAWIGLHGDGYICSCQVASRSSTSTTQLDWQHTKDKLFCDDWDTQYTASSLTYMGSTRFCLVETVAQEQGHALGDHHGCVLNLTMFGLNYNHKGELQATNRRSTRSYLVARHKGYFVPFAFWM
ncbi:unnamed protein product [Urochloa humidicola]